MKTPLPGKPILVCIQGHPVLVTSSGPLDNSTPSFSWYGYVDGMYDRGRVALVDEGVTWIRAGDTKDEQAFEVQCALVR